MCNYTIKYKIVIVGQILTPILVGGFILDHILRYTYIHKDLYMFLSKSKDALFENRRDHYDELVNLMPHDQKVFWAKTRIKEFFKECEEYNKLGPKNPITEITISFSGGKDSTVLLDLVSKVHKEIKSKFFIVPAYAVEITFPSTIKFIKDVVEDYRKENKYIKEPLLVPPKLPWNDILETKGYPIFSKQISVLINRVKRSKTKNGLTQWFFGVNEEITNTAKYKLSKQRLFLLDDNMINKWPKLKDKELIEYFKKYNEPYFFSEKCCDYVKGNLKHDNRPSFIGVTTEESEMRKKSWIQNGCNIFNSKNKKSRPISIWKSSDIWKYIKDNDLPINPAYGYKKDKPLEEQKYNFNRLGCSACPFGSAIEERKIISLKKKNIYKDDDPEVLNRFEKLLKFYPNIYNSQVISTGMYRVLIDMDIKINNDEKYMKLYEKRRKQINEWYEHDNFRNNIIDVMFQIQKPYNDNGWNYSRDEINEALKHFGFTNTKEKMTKKEYDEKWLKIYNKKPRY